MCYTVLCYGATAEERIIGGHETPMGEFLAPKPNAGQGEFWKPAISAPDEVITLWSFCVMKW